MAKTVFKRGKKNGFYTVKGEVSQQDIMDMANYLVNQRFRRRRRINSPQDIKSYLTVRMAHYEREAFGVVFLDSRWGIIDWEILFKGTIDAAPVYPREVVKRSLELNAAAVILFHNHPSGIVEPSRDDKDTTNAVSKALGLVDIRVLDHLVVGGGDALSFAELGLV